MNSKMGINLKVEYSSANLSSNSEVILSGRCTSTPKDSNQLPLNDLEQSFDSIREKTNPDLSYLNRVVNLAPVPIFGRRNLQILNNYVNKGVTVLSKETVGLLLKNEENVDKCLDKSNVRNKFSDKKKEYKKERSTSVTRQLRQQIKKSENQKLRNSSNKILGTCRVAVVKGVKYPTTRRRSSHNESKLPVLKINSKGPRSPKLLTAIRARLKQNRDRLQKENEKMEGPLKCIFNHEKKYCEGITRKSNSIKTISKATKLSLPSTTTATYVKQYQIHSYTRGKAELNKKNRLTQLKTSNKQQRDDIRKLTSFKAQPIRKYSPLPCVKKRSITIPQSPKLGKCRHLNSYHR